MNVTEIDASSSSLLVYANEIMVMRARGDWCAPDRPAGTTMLLVPPHEIREEEVDDGDAFGRACTIIPFRQRGGWVLAHRLARRMVDAQVRGAQAGTGCCTALNLSGFRHSRDLWNVGPIVLGRELVAFQGFVDEIFNPPKSFLSPRRIAEMVAARAEARARRAALAIPLSPIKIVTNAEELMASVKEAHRRCHQV